MTSAYLSLKWRLKQRGYWAAFLGMYVPYVGLNLWPALHDGKSLSREGLIAGVLPPFLYLFGMAILSPVAWQVQRKGAGGLLPKALLAFLAAQVYMFVVLVAETGIRWLLGKPFELASALPWQIVFHAPAMALIGGVIAARENLRNVNQGLLAQAREAQSRALQGQLHPHVLFNALNGLAELIHKDPQRAEESVQHLSDLLRKVLDAADDPVYTLGDERGILEHYLDMESLRLGKRLRQEWIWDRRLDDFRLPPLLLQPLVENAIKHGIAPCRTGGALQLETRREGPDVILSIRNTGSPLDAPATPETEGIGLSNLRSRLELEFGEAATLSLHPEHGWTVAELRLPGGSLRRQEMTA